ncbi:hypothetical protein L1987_57599 [Smallanthus sonchifolius]|uniref:Uncharacterized protein n=1 Tax=Smallanthus sonchifolius TaxID=185202 RepID=A0ACB9DDH5_9ASTR|nr:hypothetical protein L1987_57599 [Smallanthus sonchifolius]
MMASLQARLFAWHLARRLQFAYLSDVRVHTARLDSSCPYGRAWCRARRSAYLAECPRAHRALDSSCPYGGAWCRARRAARSGFRQTGSTKSAGVDFMTVKEQLAMSVEQDDAWG